MKFDIDGYTEKAELSRTKLITAIVTALRGYKLVTSLEGNRLKLKQLNAHFSEIVQKNAIHDFASTALRHFSELVGRPVDGMLCGMEVVPELGTFDRSNIRVLAASGELSAKLDLPIGVIGDAGISLAVNSCIETQTLQACDDGIAMPLITRNEMAGALFVRLSEEELEETIGEEVFQLFVSNVALGYEKTGLMEHIRDLAYVDRVTGLSTFSGFLESFRRHASQHMPLLVVHLDIQRFRVIVDGIGDEKAGAVLKKAGHCLSQTFPDALTIARKEKDEFLLLLKGGEENGVQDVVARVEGAFLEPITVDDNQITLRLRLGFAATGDDVDAENAEKLVRHASIALNDVRQKGLTNHAIFHPLMQEAAFERLRLASLLTGGAKQTELSAHYQPIMHAHDESIASFEALMRFRSSFRHLPEHRQDDRGGRGQWPYYGNRRVDVQNRLCRICPDGRLGRNGRPQCEPVAEAGADQPDLQGY